MRAFQCTFTGSNFPKRPCVLCDDKNPACVRCLLRREAANQPPPEVEPDPPELNARLAVLTDITKKRPLIIGLVSCGKAKQKDKGRHRARDMYTSPLFRASLAYLEANCDEVFILSGKHGLLKPNQEIDWYDQRLTRKQDDLRWWAMNVEASLRLSLVYAGKVLPTRLVVMGGKEYIEPIRSTIDWALDWVFPLDGMNIFDRNSWASMWRKLSSGNVKGVA